MSPPKFSRLTIFEGPDGGGKSFAARAYAQATGAELIHHGPYPGETTDQLVFRYIRSMVPALIHEHPVVLDRCWLSEFVYGPVFRGGKLRLGIRQTDQLERLAMLCDPLVVLCLPDPSTCLTNFQNRKPEEYLDTERQLLEVYDRYNSVDWFMERRTSLPVTTYDYTITPQFEEMRP